MTGRATTFVNFNPDPPASGVPANFSPAPDPSAKKNRKRRIGLTGLVFIAVGLILLFSANAMPLTWDEGDAFDRADRVTSWCRQFKSDLAQGTTLPLDHQSLTEAFPHTIVREGHPAGYTLVIAMGQTFCQTCLPNLLPAKLEYRFGTLLLFTLALTSVFYRVARDNNLTTGLLCVFCILLIPRLFGHAQIAACDSPLCACWMLVWAWFDDKTWSWRAAVVWGVLLGLGLAMKFTGWLIPLPFLVFGACCCIKKSARWQIIRFFLIGLTIAIGTFILLNPPIWHAPCSGLRTFIYLNTHRGNFNIPIWFLGDFYNLDKSLPWYNAFFWIAITVPLALLFLAVYRIMNRVVRPLVARENADAATLLLLLNFLTLPLVRCVPHVPVHDGVRLFIAAFPFLGLLAGLGTADLLGILPGREGPACITAKTYSARTRQAVVVLLLATATLNLGWYASQWLSFYNAAIGGLRGAVSAGMERTYYWDALDREVIDWLNAHSSPESGEEGVLFSAFSSATLRRYNQWGILKPTGYTITDGMPNLVERKIRWYVLQCRPSGLTHFDLALIKSAKPVWTKRIRHGGFGPWRLDSVPLIAIYDLSESPLIHPTTSDSCPNPHQ